MSLVGQRYLAGSSSDFREGVLVARAVAGVDVILTRIADRVVCFRDQCSHQPVKLSEFGEVRGRVLICHAHGGGFDLAQGGSVLCRPPKEPLTAYRCHEEDDQVYVIIE